MATHHKPAHPVIRHPPTGGGAPGQGGHTGSHAKPLPRPGSPAPGSMSPIGLVRHAKPEHELLLMPGQFYFGREPGSIRTLLGSCVALTLWHPQRRIGGMCHYLLPERQRSAAQPPDGRFGTEAIALLVDQLTRAGTRTADYEVHLYGGADTLPDHLTHKTQVGVRNIELGWTLVDKHGFQLVGVDVGDNVPRTVRLDMRSGEVTMRRAER
jgi:chemotaxis protein CheD